ncbi:hypothetical protein C7H19_13000 [Aphanothece hegewaldii CCALA 016]|uniref:Uncharacterized protein n=1 Tax=Aphanothece hegewaldii CCALA 016 TaxID=2107694 RepID=A0A2T1LWR5_9CHRO|nr:hypothetical protein [Aphanothece hegewaldii]PSF36592.1 hypothetical protein C7H19_13000 [Aphanothece hegewaldii CCALA 016]
MSITVTGKVEKSGFGVGVWALITDMGTTYELYNPPAQLKKTQSKVTVTGNIREDIMTIAMIGPVLEVTDFQT